MPSAIHLLITACLIGNPNACGEIDAPTPFDTVKQCEGGAQPLLAQIMADYPERVVARYQCRQVNVWREA